MLSENMWTRVLSLFYLILAPFYSYVIVMVGEGRDSQLKYGDGDNGDFGGRGNGAMFGTRLGYMDCSREYLPDDMQDQYSQQFREMNFGVWDPDGIWHTRKLVNYLWSNYQVTQQNQVAEIIIVEQLNSIIGGESVICRREYYCKCN